MINLTLNKWEWTFVNMTSGYDREGETDPNSTYKKLPELHLLIILGSILPIGKKLIPRSQSQKGKRQHAI